VGLDSSDYIFCPEGINRETFRFRRIESPPICLLGLRKLISNRHLHESTVGIEFLKPLDRFLDLSRSRRNCPALPDELWLEVGIRRCLKLFQSGRDFLQDLADRHDTDILRTTFSESLKSRRRLALLSEILAQVQVHMRLTQPDPFAAFKCLADFALYAGDGHFISAASHDKAKPRKSPINEKTPGRIAAFTATKYATGHLYTLCLRSHCMTHLTVGDQVERDKEHDMRALKRQDVLTLRQGAARGCKVLYIWDRAGTAIREWFKWKERGIYFLSRHLQRRIPTPRRGAAARLPRYLARETTQARRLG